MSLNVTREHRRYLAIENAKYPEHLISIPRCEWPSSAAWFKKQPQEVWRSRRFLVQIFNEGQAERITVCRTRITGQTWQDGISWDELQRLKNECGRGHKWAVEIYPADAEVVNVANMRHIWVLDEAPHFAWRKEPVAHQGDRE